MNKQAKLTVVLPIASYNMHWLDRCLGSCLGVADELVIVTDGAQYSEGWSDMADSLIAQLPHHNLITMPAKGLAMALNVGIAAASHNWISFLCSDDWYDVEGMQTFKHLAYDADNRPPQVGTFDIIGGVTHSTGHLGEGYWPKHGDISQIKTECSITSPALFRKELWWKVGGYSDKRYLDWHYWNKCIDAGAKYKFHQAVMYHYQAWPGTISARYGYSANLGFEWGDGPKER